MVRFSKLAGISLAVVVVTGVVRTADELGGWGRLVDSRFGRALDLKLLLFAGLVGLGALNRYRLVPLFQAGARRRAAARLRRSVGAELGLAACWPPPPCSASWPRAPRTGPGGAGGHAGPGGQQGRLGHHRQGHLDRDPGGRRAQPLHRHRGRLRHRAVLPADRVELTGTPASHPDLAGARLQAGQAADGRWLGQGRLLSLAGRWNLTTTIQRPAGGTASPWPWRSRPGPRLTPGSRRTRNVARSRLVP